MLTSCGRMESPAWSWLESESRVPEGPGGRPSYPCELVAESFPSFSTIHTIASVSRPQ